jgi:hypothetical protein
MITSARPRGMVAAVGRSGETCDLHRAFQAD